MVLVPWNLTHWKRKYVNADILALSIAKNGRPWLRVPLLYRDPRDVGVSLCFQTMKRSADSHADRGVENLFEFIRHPRQGIAAMVDTMNVRHERLRNHPGCFRVSYEDLHADAEGALSRCIEFCGVTCDPERVRQSVEFASFENMRRMEAKNSFGSKKLSPGDVKDKNSYKVREGKVGGYAKRFSSEGIASRDEAVARLDRSYGYEPTK